MAGHAAALPGRSGPRLLQLLGNGQKLVQCSEVLLYMALTPTFQGKGLA